MPKYTLQTCSILCVAVMVPMQHQPLHNSLTLAPRIFSVVSDELDEELTLDPPDSINSSHYFRKRNRIICRIRLSGAWLSKDWRSARKCTGAFEALQSYKLHVGFCPPSLLALNQAASLSNPWQARRSLTLKFDLVVRCSISKSIISALGDKLFSVDKSVNVKQSKLCCWKSEG